MTAWLKLALQRTTAAGVLVALGVAMWGVGILSSDDRLLYSGVGLVAIGRFFELQSDVRALRRRVDRLEARP